MSRVTRQYGSWSMAAGMRAGTFSPVSFLCMKHGAAWMAGQKIQPMLVLSWKPNVLRAVL